MLTLTGKYFKALVKSYSNNINLSFASHFVSVCISCSTIDLLPCTGRELVSRKPSVWPEVEASCCAIYVQMVCGRALQAKHVYHHAKQSDATVLLCCVSCLISLQTPSLNCAFCQPHTSICCCTSCSRLSIQNRQILKRSFKWSLHHSSVTLTPICCLVVVFLRMPIICAFALLSCSSLPICPSLPILHSFFSLAFLSRSYCPPLQLVWGSFLFSPPPLTLK